MTISRIARVTNFGILLLACLIDGAEGVAAEPAPAPPATTTKPAGAAETDELFRLGREWFEQMASPEVKAQYEFPSREQWDAMVQRVQRVLAGDSLAELGALAAEARSTLTLLRTVPGYEDLADWLEQRLDEMEGAQQTLSPPRPAPGPQTPLRPGTPRPAVVQPVPHYNLWLERVRARPLPARARELMPRLQAAFRAEGVPEELAWLAEAESSLNPTARSPVGAKGLFQFMPDTAKAMGLSTFLPDDRTDPDRSARAAARYLRKLHGRFGNWALAMAAYNAGEGRVGRTLTAKRATTYTAIADALPAETRMYVPKVCALIATRAGVTPDRIAPPR
jgi:membrane-bound lytic murein transglycosylase D